MFAPGGSPGIISALPVAQAMSTAGGPRDIRCNYGSFVRYFTTKPLHAMPSGSLPGSGTAPRHSRRRLHAPVLVPPARNARHGGAVMSRASSSRPGADEHAPFYASYVALVPDGDVTRTLAGQGEGFVRLLKDIGDGKAGFAYAAGKWTIKEVVLHVTDAERIFAYRVLRMARGDATPLASFDENAYAPMSGANDRPLDTLLG